MKSNRTYSILRIAAIFIAAMFLFAHCKKDEDQNATRPDDVLLPIAYGYDVQTLLSDSGKVKVRLTTQEYQEYRNDTTAFRLFPKGLKVERFKSDMSIESEIQSKYAIYYSKEEFIEMRDSVFAMNEKGETFETDTLFWDRAKRTVFTNTKIKITQPSGTFIIANAFKSNDNFTKYSIIKAHDSLLDVDMDE